MPGVTFAGTFGVAVNTTGVAVNETFTVAGEEIALTLPAGPFVRVEGTGIQLTVATQTLSGDFSFEQMQRVGGGKVVRIAVANGAFELKDGTNTVLSLTNASGNFLIKNGATPAEKGIAGEIRGTVALNIPGVSLSGTLGLQINDTPNAINEEFMVAGQTVGLVLPAGKFLRVSGEDVALDIAGQKISGDFAIERITSTNGASLTRQVVRVAIANATLALGYGTIDIVVVSGAAPYFVPPTGLAGQFGGTVTVNVPTAFSGDFTVQVNNTGLAINEQFNVGNLTRDLSFERAEQRHRRHPLALARRFRSPPAAVRRSASISTGARDRRRGARRDQ